MTDKKRNARVISEENYLNFLIHHEKLETT